MVSNILPFGWNFFQGLFGFEISGINVDSWKMISHENTGNVPDIVSGGSFGIEGSVITLSCTIICTYLIYKYYNDNQNKKYFIMLSNCLLSIILSAFLILQTSRKGCLKILIQERQCS